MEALGEQQVQELAEKYFPDVVVDLRRASVTVTKEESREKCAAAIREAHELGRTQGLEEAAKIAFSRGEKYQKQLDNCGSSHELEYDECDITSMQANEAWAIAATIRQLAEKNPVE